MKKLLTTPIVKVIPQITIKDLAKLYCYYQLARIFDTVVARQGEKVMTDANVNKVAKATTKAVEHVIYGPDDEKDTTNEPHESTEQGVQ